MVENCRSGQSQRREKKFINRASTPGYIKRFVAIIAALAGVILTVAVIAGCGGEQNSSNGTAPVDRNTDAATALPADSGGRLQIAETLYDFGSVPVGQKVEHEFTIKNIGSGPLSVGKLDVKRLEGCWDAQAVVGSTTISPGESTTVTVSMQMGKGMGGQHHFDVTINSNDPSPAVSKVAVRANYT